MTVKTFVRLALFAILLLAVLVEDTPVLSATKRLAFAYVDLDAVGPESVRLCAGATNIDGLSLLMRWKTIEKRKGQYDFSKLDAAISEVAKHGKFVTICLMGSPKTPDWLANEKIQFFTSVSLSHSITVEPVPWDANYLIAYKKFLAATSVHLKKLNMMPYVFGVTVAAPSEESTLLDCRRNKIGGVPYDRNKYMAACTQMIDSYHAEFPTARQFLIAPQNCMICAPDEDKMFFQEVMDYGLHKYGRSCWILAKDLKADGSVNGNSVQSIAGRSALGLQFASSSQLTNDRGLGGTFPSNFQQAIDRGIAGGAIYFEIYGSDAVSDNPAIRAAIASIHR